MGVVEKRSLSRIPKESISRRHRMPLLAPFGAKCKLPKALDVLLPRGGATLVSKAAEALEKTRFMESERNLISGNLLI